VRTLINGLRAAAVGAAAVLIAAGAALGQAGRTIDVIAFGSCARERKPQPIWTEVLATKPDLFLFIGDNNYADVWEEDGKMVMKPIPHIDRLKEAYAAQFAHAGFRRLVREVPLMATWDDHDYGANDGGREFTLREESKQVFLDMYGFGADAPQRKQPGVYHARVFGPEGRRVQVIMLDTRYNRDQLEGREGEPGKPGRKPYKPTQDTSKTILGKEQWAWLEGELKKPAEVRIIASSIQVVADGHGSETWGNMPHERERLYGLIRKTKASGVVFISGDRHQCEISREPGNLPGREAPYAMWDFTSSGLNLEARPALEANPLRVGPMRKEPNFGTVRIAWAEPVERTAIEFKGIGDQGQILTMQTVWLGELKAKE